VRALILAGGFGTRLAHIVKDVPKPMAPIGSRPFLEYLVDRLGASGIVDITLLTGYKAEVIMRHFGDGTSRALSISYSNEDSPLGTGGAIKAALESLDRSEEDVLVLNGDTFFDLPYGDFLLRHLKCRPPATIALKYLASTDRYGSVELDGNRVREFVEKGAAHGAGLINAGVYCLNREAILGLSPRGPFSFEKVVLERLVGTGGIMGIPYPGKFIDIGVPADYQRASESLDAWISEPKRRAVFMDRDGVINLDDGYTSGDDEIAFVPGAIDFMRSVLALGYEIVVVTNQAGIAKGKFSQADYETFTKRLNSVLVSEGIRVLDFSYCPYHPEAIIDEYRRVSLDRKPGPGMILKAAERFSIDISDSWMIGDSVSDVIELPYLRTLLLRGANPIPEDLPPYDGFEEILEKIMLADDDAFRRAPIRGD
jgi:D,D-heptose 1,7-bisphosphate phosphatase